jgi:hypothetical protein
MLVWKPLQCPKACTSWTQQFNIFKTIAFEHIYCNIQVRYKLGTGVEMFTRVKHTRSFEPKIQLLKSIKRALEMSKET